MKHWWLLLFLAACGETRQFAGECKVSEDCPVGAACRIRSGDTTGLCVCRSDEACEPGEVCNSQGICQKRAGCRSNAECEAAKFCDLASGACIERTGCGYDVHCVAGTVCDPALGRCVDGCYSNGDCPLYSVCDKAASADFSVKGVCIQGRCGDKSFCGYGERCVNGSCQRDPNPSHCATCSGNQPCPARSDFCLINSAYDPGRPENGGPNFCGAECQNETDCPNGYQCGGVVLLTQDQCTDNTQCGGGGRQCVLGEGDLRGFCTCVSDADCAFDSIPALCAGSCGGLGLRPCLQDTDCLASRCEFTRRICTNPAGQSCTDDAQCQAQTLCANQPGFGQVCLTDGSPCQTSADCLCDATGTCVNSGRPCQRGSDCNPPCMGGGCVLGAACAPIQGLLCPDVR